MTERRRAADRCDISEVQWLDWTFETPIEDTERRIRPVRDRRELMQCRNVPFRIDLGGLHEPAKGSFQAQNHNDATLYLFRDGL